MRIRANILVALVVCAPSRADEKPSASEVESFRVYISRLETSGTEVTVSDFRGPGMWSKRKYMGRDLQFELAKKGSPPIVSARATWKIKTFVTAPFPTKEEAEKADLPQKGREPAVPDFWGEFVLEDGKWIVKDIGWKAPTLKLERKHSTSTNTKDSIHDWWRALGGK